MYLLFMDLSWPFQFELCLACKLCSNKNVFLFLQNQMTNSFLMKPNVCIQWHVGKDWFFSKENLASVQVCLTKNWFILPQIFEPSRKEPVEHILLDASKAPRHSQQHFTRMIHKLLEELKNKQQIFRNLLYLAQFCDDFWQEIFIVYFV